MTLLETERLSRKLAAAVNQPPVAAVALKLAEDFVATCRAANLRLRQCEGMLNSGDVPQALQLAEAAPNLLDLITLLEFRESDTWRAYCHANRLPAAEPLDSRAVHRLNEAYAIGISTEDPLYRRYRKAVLTKNEDEACAVLRSITRLNPSDTNAAAELARLDAKVLGEKVAVLSRAVDTATLAQVAHLVEAIETGGFLTHPTGAEWRRAQRVRSSHLLALAEESRRTEDWRKALSHLELIQHLKAECEFELSGAEQSRFTPLKKWADAGLKRHLQDQEFAEHLSELSSLLAANEQKDTMARAVPLDEMKADYEALHREWRAIQDLARPVPEDLSSRFRKRSSLLEAEISRRTRRRVQTVVAGVAALLVVGGLAVWWGLTQFHARDFTRQLAAAEQSRQLRTVEKLIEHIKEKEQRLLGVGALNSALAKSETFTAHERDLLKRFQDAFATLPENPAPGLSAAQITATQTQFENAKGLFAKIASDTQTEQQPRLTAFQNKWEHTLVAESATLNANYEGKLKRLEQEAPRLDYLADVEQTRRLLAALSPLLLQLRETDKLFTSNVTVRLDLRQRRELVGARIVAFERELLSFDEVVKAMQQAKGFRDFSAAVEQLAHSEFSASPLVVTAKERRIVEFSDEALLQSLLCRGNAALALYLKTHAVDKFMPSAAMPAEIKRAQEIRSAIATGANLRRYWLKRENNTIEWLTVGPLNEATGWRKISAYAPAESPRAFILIPADYGFFDGRFRLSSEKVLYSVQDLGPCQETLFADALGFDFPQVGESWRRPLLPALDQVNGATNGSPLFRAYLFLRYVEMMQLQPESWGLIFCPAARAHYDELREVANGLRSGDWFAPTPRSILSPRLEVFFQSAKQVSYWKQAQALATVARQTWDSGLRLAGYVDLDGQPRLTAASAPTELWGFDGDKSPALLFRSNSGHHAPLRQPMPLSPLFALTQERAALLSRAGVNPKDKLFAGQLPPLFADLAETK